MLARTTHIGSPIVYLQSCEWLRTRRKVSAGALRQWRSLIEMRLCRHLIAQSVVAAILVYGPQVAGQQPRRLTGA
jgi:hypothetical protein